MHYIDFIFIVFIFLYS